MKKLFYLFGIFVFLNLYLASEALADPPTWPVCGEIYKIENDKVYYCSGGEYFEIMGADVGSFEELPYAELSKDKNAVYCGVDNIGADPKTFTAVGGSTGYYKDSSQVFFHCSVLENSDPASFKNLGGDYNQDKNNVYNQGLILEGVDRETFQVLGVGSYATDAGRVYFRYNVIEGADPASFELGNFSFSAECETHAEAKDKYAYYSNGFKTCDVAVEDQPLEFVFNDVDSTHRFFEAIKYVKEAGFVQGYPDGSYQPERQIDRYEFTKIITNAVLSEADINSCDLNKYSFPDVPQDEWFSKYVCAAKRNSVIKGYDDGYFRGTKNIILPEALKIVFKSFGVNTEYYTGEEWYSEYMTVAEKKNLLGPVGPFNNDFMYTITRGDMAFLTMTLAEEQKNGTLNAHVPENYASTFQNLYFKLSVFDDWQVEEVMELVQDQKYDAAKDEVVYVDEPTEVATGAINVIKDGYILYINPVASQGSGVSGGRFSEIASGAPGVDLVIKNHPSDSCGSAEGQSFDNLYVEDFYINQLEDRLDMCNVPSDERTLWYFSYITSAGDGYFGETKDISPQAIYAGGQFVITMTYDAKSIDELPLKSGYLDEMKGMVRTLEFL